MAPSYPLQSPSVFLINGFLSSYCLILKKHGSEPSVRLCVPHMPSFFRFRPLPHAIFQAVMLLKSHVLSLAYLQAKHFSFANISLYTNPRCSHCMLITVWLSGSFQPTVSRQTCLLHSPCVSTLSLMITPNHGENPQMGCVFMQLSQR